VKLFYKVLEVIVNLIYKPLFIYFCVYVYILSYLHFMKAEDLCQRRYGSMELDTSLLLPSNLLISSGVKNVAVSEILTHDSAFKMERHAAMLCYFIPQRLLPGAVKSELGVGHCNYKGGVEKRTQSSGKEIPH